MSTSRTRLAGLTAVGFETFSLSNSTARGLNSTTRNGREFVVSVETNAVRYRDDGTNPALTTGVYLATGTYQLAFGSTTNLKFQRSTGTAKVSIMAYKYPGD